MDYHEDHGMIGEDYVMGDWILLPVISCLICSFRAIRIPWIDSVGGQEHLKRYIPECVYLGPILLKHH